jgi:hypothetical protein
MGNFHGRRVLESLNQYALPLMGGIGILTRPPQNCHPAFPYPLLRPVQEGLRYRIIFNNLEEAEETCLAAVVIIKAMVDPADTGRRFAVPQARKWVLGILC